MKSNLRSDLPVWSDLGCEVFTTYQRGWSELKNGDLLRAAETAGFEVFVTSDKNIRHQQNLAARRIAIVVLPTNTVQLPSAQISVT